MFIKQINKLCVLMCAILLLSFTSTAYSQIIVNSCPTATGDLTTRVTSTPPAGTTVTYHTGSPATDANKFTGDASAAPVGTYYVAYWDSVNNCYSPVSEPLYVAKCVTNTCPATNADLTGVATGSSNGNGVLEWHTSNTPSPATKVADITSVGAGTYWAVYYDSSSGGCYSPVSNPVVVTIEDCTFTVSGTVFDDGDAGNVGGTPIQSPDGTPLYATLVDSNGNVVQSVPVDSSGNYEFTNVPAGTYDVQIGTTDESGNVGSAPSAPSLPADWNNTADGAEGTAGDGTADGKQSVTVGTGDVADVDFGINKAPVANDVTATSQDNPGGATQVQATSPDVSDNEDGTPTTIKITELPTDGSTLYYDGVAVTAGQVIPNFDPTKLTIDPADGTTTATYKYTTIDAAGVESDEATVSMPFGEPNSTSAENDINQTPQGTPVSGNLLTNDVDPEGDTQEVSSITVNGTEINIPSGGSSGPQVIPGVGTIEVNSDGSYTFTPDPDYSGDVPPISYTVTDSNGATDSAQLNLTVIPDLPDGNGQVPPVANNDTNTVEQGSTVTTNFLANDSDPEGQTVQLSPTTLKGLDSSGNPITIPVSDGSTTVTVYDENGNTAGTAYINAAGELVFTADPNFTGDVPFTYTVEDTDDLTDTATITITVEPSDPDTDLTANPDATNGPSSTTANDPNAQQTGNVVTNDNDPDNSGSITVTGFETSDGTTSGTGTTTTLPSGGTLIMYNDGSYTYNPAPGFVGTEVVEYTVTDGNGDTSTSTLSLTTVATSPPPVANDDTNTVEQGSTVTTDFLANDSDPEDQAVTLVPNSMTGLDSSGNPVVIPTGGSGDAVTVYDANGNPAGTAYVDSTTGKLVFVSDPTFTGDVPFEYEVIDPDGLKDTASINIQVVPSNNTNDTVANDDTNSGPVDVDQTGNLLANDNDPDGDTQSIKSITVDTDGDGNPEAVTPVAGTPTPIYQTVDGVVKKVGEITVDPATGDYVWNPEPDFEGTAVIPYTTKDDNATEATDNATLYLTTIGVEQIVLPVELVSFNAEPSNVDAVLTWTTASEENSSHYEIYRSLDGVNFSFVERVETHADANGNSDVELNYEYLHKGAAFIDNQFVENVYYQVKQVDLDGQSMLTEIRLVNFSDAVVEAMVFPNPAVKGGEVVIQSDQIHTVAVYDMTGKVVKTIDGLNGVKSTSITTDNMKTGMYIVIINGTVKQKLVIN